MPSDGEVVTVGGIYYRFFSQGSFFMVGKENRSDTYVEDCIQPFAVEPGSTIKEVTIPTTIRGYPVLEIGNRAFRVNGELIPPGDICMVNEGDIFDFSGVLLLFLPNKRLIEEIRQKLDSGAPIVADHKESNSHSTDLY